MTQANREGILKAARRGYSMTRQLGWRNARSKRLAKCFENIGDAMDAATEENPAPFKDTLTYCKIARMALQGGFVKEDKINFFVILRDIERHCKQELQMPLEFPESEIIGMRARGIHE